MKPTEILEPYDVQYIEMVRHLIQAPYDNYCIKSSQPFEIMTIQLEDEFPLLKSIPMDIDSIKQSICGLITGCYDDICTMIHLLKEGRAVSQTWSRDKWDKVGDPEIDDDFVGLLHDSSSDVITVVRHGSSLNMTVMLPGEVCSLPKYIAVYAGIAKLLAYKNGIVAETITFMIVEPYVSEYNFPRFIKDLENAEILENLSHIGKDFSNELSRFLHSDSKLLNAIACTDTYPTCTFDVSPEINIDEIKPSDITIEDYIHM